MILQYQKLYAIENYSNPTHLQSFMSILKVLHEFTHTRTREQNIQRETSICHTARGNAPLDKCEIPRMCFLNP